MLIDSHIHYDLSGDVKKIERALEITGCDSCSLQSLLSMNKLNQNFDMFYAKLILKDKVYINGALDSYLYFHQDRMDEMPKYIERMEACGIDGIKMIEGKPNARRNCPIPDFDDPLYDSTFSYLEKRGLNITWHVNDPEEFWDPLKVPDWAKRSGWFYGDGGYVNNMDQYRQVENLLKKHPKLSITFAHFYFLSRDLDELSRLFDTYPNISVDITPGIELFTNMSEDIEKARAFFNKYSDRILYGTDISVDKYEKNELNEVDAMTRKNLCHDFLTKEKVFIKGDKDGLLGSSDLLINGLNLSFDKVEEIEYKNFLKRYPVNHKLNPKLILEEIKIHRTKLKEMGQSDAYLDMIEESFKKELNNH